MALTIHLLRRFLRGMPGDMPVHIAYGEYVTQGDVPGSTGPMTWLQEGDTQPVASWSQGVTLVLIAVKPK